MKKVSINQNSYDKILIKKFNKLLTNITGGIHKTSCDNLMIV
jgi:hypothetical protein